MSAAIAAAPKVVSITKPKRTASKRQRQFFLEARSLPSKLGARFGAKPGEWSPNYGPFLRIAQARDIQATLEVLGTAPGYFVRGAEYRVTRRDAKVSA